MENTDTAWRDHPDALVSARTLSSPANWHYHPRTVKTRLVKAGVRAVRPNARVTLFRAADVLEFEWRAASASSRPFRP